MAVERFIPLVSMTKAQVVPVLSIQTKRAHNQKDFIGIPLYIYLVTYETWYS